MSEWISVDDRLPEDGECVDLWVLLPDGDCGRLVNCFVSDDKAYFWRWREPRYTKKDHIGIEYVRNWMPLPIPPKEATK